MNEEAEENAEIEWSTIHRLMSYYGHWNQFVFIICLDIFIHAQRNYANYLFGQWAEDKVKQDETGPFRKQMALIFFAVLFDAIGVIAKERFRKLLVDKTLKAVHNDILSKLMKAPVNKFFDITPNGSIMKRFGEDMSKIEKIVQEFSLVVSFFSESCTVLFMVCQ